MLFVGCGGSGVKTIRMIRRRIESHLRFEGYDGPFPRAWQFLAIDVPATEDSPASLRAVDGVRYVGLTEPHAKYKGNGGADRNLLSSPGVDEFLEWRPNPNGVHANIVKGASQQRAIGRVVVSTFADKAKLAIQQAVEECTNNIDQLVSCAQALGKPVLGSTDIGQPMVVLVSSLGGGAGSGMFIDIADMLRMSARGADHWLRNNLCAVLYDPSVFEEEGNDAVGGISPNSMAAISEVVAGQWRPWRPSALLGDFVGELGSYGGPEFTFLIGSDNSTLGLKDAGQVYEFTADALATWVTNDDLGTDIEAFVFGNWSENPITSTSAMHGGAATRLPLSSFGLARVTVGNKRFGEYAERRILAGAVEKLLRQPGALGARSTGSLEEAAKTRVAEDGYAMVSRFLDACGLNEHSEAGGSAVSNDQVLDAVRDKDGLTAEMPAIEKRVRDRLSDPGQLLAQARVAADTEFAGLPEKYVRRHQERAVSWAELIQQRFLDQVLELVSREGLASTIELLQQVEHRLSESFPAQLRSEADTFLRSDPWSSLAEVFGSLQIKKGKGVPDRAKQELQRLFHGRVYNRIEADLRLVVSDVLVDMARNFVSPLIESLKDSQHALREARSKGLIPSAADTAVPHDLKPSPAEITLVGIDRFAALYEELLTDTAKSVDEAIRDVICARYGLVRSYERAVEDLYPFSLKPWRPALLDAIGSDRTASPAQVALRLSPQELMDRADYWLSSDADTPVGAFIAQGIREWITDPSVGVNERQQRGKTLAVALSRAFDLASPMAERNMTWIDQVLDMPASNAGVNTWDVHIPLAEGDPGYSEVTDVLRKRLGAIDVTGNFRAERRNSIELFTVLYPLPPSAFSSLVNPIAANWKSSATAHPRGDGTFWRHRRARPLMDAIPLHHDTRQALARGWSTARILGLVKWADRDRPATITVDGVTKPFTYPPLSGRPETPADEFGRILETALLSEFMASAGEPDGFKALEMLLALGSSDDRPESNIEYRVLNPRLAAHIDNLADPHTDGNALADDLEKSAVHLDSLSVERPRDGEWHSYPASVATAELQADALRDIATAIRHHLDPEAGDYGVAGHF